MAQTTMAMQCRAGLGGVHVVSRDQNGDHSTIIDDLRNMNSFFDSGIRKGGTCGHYIYLQY